MPSQVGGDLVLVANCTARSYSIHRDHIYFVTYLEQAVE